METADESSVNDDDDRLTLDNVIFAGSSHNRCIVCREETVTGIMMMPKAARLDLLILHTMYAPHGVRCCSSHLLNMCRLMPNAKVNTVKPLLVNTPPK